MLEKLRSAGKQLVEDGIQGDSKRVLVVIVPEEEVTHRVINSALQFVID